MQVICKAKAVGSAGRALRCTGSRYRGLTWRDKARQPVLVSPVLIERADEATHDRSRAVRRLVARRGR